MNQLIKVLLVTIVCSIMVNVSLFARNVQRLGKNMVMVDDVEFKIHNVKKKDNLFSIARSNDIPTSLIQKFNKQAANGTITTDDILLIPMIDKKKFEQSLKNFEDLDYALHYVRGKETLSLISRLYSIPQEVIVQNNPSVDFDILQIDNILILPLQFTVTQTTPTTPKLNPTTAVPTLRQHTVIQGETMYSISRLYSVSVDSMKKYNPDLSVSTLSIGTLINIPPFQSPTSNAGVATAVQMFKDCRSLHKDSALNVMVVMPFERKNEKELERTYRYLAFYDGIKLAAEEIAKQGYKINLSLATSDIVDNSSERFSKQHFVIGMLYEKEIRTLLPILQQHNIPFISAMSVSNALLTQYFNYYQVTATNESLLYNNVKKALQSSSKNNKVIITKSGSHEDKLLEKLLLQELNIEDTIRIPHRDNISDENLEQAIHAFRNLDSKESVKLFSCNMQNTAKSVSYALLKTLSATKQNTIIITSEQEPFVTQILSTLRVFKNQYKIDVKVIGSTQWQKFTSLDIELLYNNKIAIATNQHIDYGSPAIQQTIQRYQAQYFIDPTSLAFKGYDIMRYFSGAYQLYGKALGHCINATFRQPLLTSSFEMKQACPTCGFENKGAVYLDYTEDIDILMSTK